MTNNKSNDTTSVLTAYAEAVPAEPLDEGCSSSASGEVEDVVELPEIQLTDLDEEMGFVHDVIVKEQAIAVAENIFTSITSMSSHPEVDFSDLRAEWISITFFKEHNAVPLGINLMPGEVRVASLSEGSMAANSPLRPGDQVVSVNNQECESSKWDSIKVAEVLRESTGYVTVIIHNKGGASDLVESMVMKSNSNDLVGISVKQDHNRILIASFRDGSKFSNSLLNSGDTVLAINGATVTHLDKHAVADMIKSSPQSVTILARTMQDSGVVVAQLSESYIAGSNLPVITSFGDQSNANSTANNSAIRKVNETWYSNLDDNAKSLLTVFFGLLCIGVVGTIVGAAMAATQTSTDDVIYYFNNGN